MELLVVDLRFKLPRSTWLLTSETRAKVRLAAHAHMTCLRQETARLVAGFELCCLCVLNSMLFGHFAFYCY